MSKGLLHTEQRLLANHHLKEYNQNMDQEVAALYQLRMNHQSERHQLAADSIQQAELLSQHQQEIAELKQQYRDSRQTLQKRHLQEKNDLGQKGLQMLFDKVSRARR